MCVWGGGVACLCNVCVCRQGGVKDYYFLLLLLRTMLSKDLDA